MKTFYIKLKLAFCQVIVHLITFSVQETPVDKYVKHEPKGKLFTCFIDFKKAFDSVWRDGLFYKLFQYNIGAKF